MDVNWTLTTEEIEVRRQLKEAFETYTLSISPLNWILLKNGQKLEPATAPKYEWLEFTQKRIETTVGANYTSLAFTATPADLVLANTVNYKAWDTIRFETPDNKKLSSLVLYITEVTNGTTVKAMKVGGNDVAISTNDIAVLVAAAKEENSPKGEVRWVDVPVDKFNYTQIIDALYEISRTLLGSKTVAAQGTIDKLRKTAFYKMSRQLTEILSNGQRAEITDPKKWKKIRLAWGMSFYITKEIDAAGAALKLDHLNRAFEEIILWGGLPTAIRTNTSQARALSGLDRSKLTINIWDNQTGTVVQVYQADIPVQWSKINTIILDTSMPQNEIEMFDISKMALVPYSNWAIREEDATEKGQDGATIRMIGEYTYVHEDAENTARRIKNLQVPAN